MATRIGVDNLVYAIMTTEDTATTSAVFAAPVSAPGVMSITVNPNPSMETLFADDGPMETASTLGKIELEIQKNQLSTADKAALLGHQIDGNGALVFGDSDVPPYVAIGFRSLKSNGTYKYVWLYKGKFTDPEDKLETKGDSINFQTDTFKGSFVKLNKSVTINSKVVRPWKYELDGEYAGANATAIANWFTAVSMPSAAPGTVAAALVMAIAQGVASGTTKLTITGAAGGSNNFGYKITREATAIPVTTDRIAGLTTYVSAADIPEVFAGDIISMYEIVTATNLAVKYATVTVVAADIKP